MQLTSLKLTDYVTKNIRHSGCLSVCTWNVIHIALCWTCSLSSVYSYSHSFYYTCLLCSVHRYPLLLVIPARFLIGGICIVLNTFLYKCENFIWCFWKYGAFFFLFCKIIRCFLCIFVLSMYITKTKFMST